MKKNNGLLKENSNNQELQKQTVQRPCTNADEVPLIVPGNIDKNGGDSRPRATQLRE